VAHRGLCRTHEDARPGDPGGRGRQPDDAAASTRARNAQEAKAEDAATLVSTQHLEAHSGPIRGLPDPQGGRVPLQVFAWGAGTTPSPRQCEGLRMSLHSWCHPGRTKRNPLLLRWRWWRGGQLNDPRAPGLGRTRAPVPGRAVLPGRAPLKKPEKTCRPSWSSAWASWPAPRAAPAGPPDQATSRDPLRGGVKVSVSNGSLPGRAGWHGA
jgi:hypothetical protein